MTPHANTVPMLGKTIDQLTVIRFAGKDKDWHATWICKCTCGRETQPMRGSFLRRRERERATVACDHCKPYLLKERHAIACGHLVKPRRGNHRPPCHACGDLSHRVVGVVCRSCQRIYAPEKIEHVLIAPPSNWVRAMGSPES